MTIKHIFILGASLFAAILSGPASAQDTQDPYVQVAEIEIEPSQLDAYAAAVKEQIERPFASNQVSSCFTRWLRKTIPRGFGYSKFIGIPVRTGHISKRHISKNTRPPLKKWSSLSSLSSQRLSA
jgi:hypothetical protein